MTYDQNRLNELVAEGRQIRVALADIVAQGAVLRAKRDARWEQHKAAYDALKANPSEATARAYVAADTNNDELYRRMSELDTLRSSAISDLREVQRQAASVLGIGIDEQFLEWI